MLPLTEDAIRNSFRGVFLLIPLALVGILTSFLPAQAENTPAVLARSFETSTQKIPLLVEQSSNAKITVEWLQLKCDSLADADNPNDGPQFQFDSPTENATFGSFPSQMWISALASAMAWQQPWLNVKWTVTAPPQGDVSASGAALGIALIATASGSDYPQDTLVLGRIRPDGSLGAVTRAATRLQVAAAAGIKRIVIPNAQRLDVTDQDSRNLPALAEKLGIECLAVDDFIQATEVVLNKKMPAASVSNELPRYSNKVLVALDSKCKSDITLLRSESKSWPRSEAQFNTLSPQDRPLWQKIFRNTDLAIEAYNRGNLYSAHELSKQVRAGLSGLVEIRAVGDNFDFKTYDARGTAIRKKMTERTSKPAIDKNELQSVLVLAEENDWLYRLNASVEGAQIIARQVFAPRSEATPQQKLLAQSMLVSAVAAAEQQMKDANFYEELYPLLVSKDEVPVYNRGSIWLPQLQSAQLGSAEFFISGLQSRVSDFGSNLLFDARLASFERLLHDNKAAWDKKQQELAEALAASKKEAGDPDKIGFVPGDGYSVPKSPTPPPPVHNLSDAALCLNWANEYCELATLNEKYLHLGATFDVTTLQWIIKDSAALQNQLQVAEAGARRGISLAENAGIDTSALALIYESASTLRTSSDNTARLEGLRQYWRCALLGSLSWQLGYLPQAVADGPEVAATTSDSLRLPTPNPIIVKTSGFTSSIITAPPPFLGTAPPQ